MPRPYTLHVVTVEQTRSPKSRSNLARFFTLTFTTAQPPAVPLKSVLYCDL